MVSGTRIILAALLSVGLAAPALAGAGPQDTAKPFGDSATEQIFRIPMAPPKAPDQVLLLEATVYRPNVPGRAKTVIVNHGSPRDAKDRRNDGRARFESVANWFLAKGWVVVVPMRRGYAQSEGEWAEGYGTCENPDFHTAGLSTANDLGAVLRYVRGLDFVDPDHLVVLGQSAGAWGTLAAAGRNLPGVTGAIAVAPGRGSLEEGKNCASERLVEAAARFGAKGKVPVLWLSTSNDGYFAPDLVTRMVEAYGAGGAPVEHVALASFGRDGHSLLREPMFTAYWTIPVEAFLRRLGEM